MSEKVLQITLDEKVELEAKLDHLIHVRKPEIIERLQIARSYGDLSENSEYDAAKDEQAHLDREIKDLTELLNKAQVIDVRNISKDIISLGKTIEVEFLDTHEVKSFHMVSNTSVNIFEDKISLDAPFGIAVNGHAVNDVVTVLSPDGPYEVKILKIELTKKDEDENAK